MNNTRPNQHQRPLDRPLKFPTHRSQRRAGSTHGQVPCQLPESHNEVLAAFSTVSRRIQDLARELKCLGYFDEDDDRPRAA